MSGPRRTALSVGSGSGLADGAAGPLSVGSTVRIRTGYAAPGTGGDATWSVNGALGANVVTNEHLLKNSWSGNNTVAVQNTHAGPNTYSAVRFLRTDGKEGAAVGWGNDNADYDGPFGAAAYLESSGQVNADGTTDTAAIAPPLRFVTSGKIGALGISQYARFGLESDGIAHFWNLAGGFSARKDVFVVDQANQIAKATVDVTGAFAFQARNRHGAGYSAVELRDDSDVYKGGVGYANATAPATALQSGTFLLSASTTTTPVPIRVAQLVSSTSYRIREDFRADGGWSLYKLDGTTKSIDLDGSTGLLTFLNSAAGGNPVAVRNTHADGYSAFSFRDSNNVEQAVAGSGNSNVVFTSLRNAAYWMSVSADATPRAIKFCQFYSGASVPRIGLEMGTDSKIRIQDINGNKLIEAGGTSAVLGFFGGTPITRETIAAVATDAATTQTLANDLRTKLINLGLMAA